MLTRLGNSLTVNAFQKFSYKNGVHMPPVSLGKKNLAYIHLYAVMDHFDIPPEDLPDIILFNRTYRSIWLHLPFEGVNN
jgi:hypothetical protein